MSNRKRMFEPVPQEEEEENPFTGTKDPYKILGVERGCTKEEVKIAYKNYLLKVHPDKALKWDILNPDESTLACREVISAKKFFDDFFSVDPTSSSSTSSQVAKRHKTNLKPFEFTEEERESFFEDCESRVSDMEELIISQGKQIKSGLKREGNERNSLELLSKTHEKIRNEIRNIGTIIYKLKRSKVNTNDHEDLENID